MRTALCVRTLTGVAERECLAKTLAAKSGMNPRHEAVAREDWDDSDGDPDLWLYRDRCIALLKRYVRLAVEIGRLPSLLGREFFRGRVTSYTASTFEESVIFVHDMEHSLEKLDSFGQKLIAKIVLEEYSQREAAKLLNCPLRTVERFFPEALDQLSEILLAGEILMPLHGSSRVRQKSCQGGQSIEKGASCCNHGE
jgi:hypothetical protein